MTYYLALVFVLVMDGTTPPEAVWITDDYARISLKQCQKNLAQIISVLPEYMKTVNARCVEFKFGQES